MDDNEKGRCSRAVFGIVLGALATLGSVWIVGLKIATSKAPFLVEVAMAFLLLILYGFGVISITGQKGPGVSGIAVFLNFFELIFVRTCQLYWY